MNEGTTRVHFVTQGKNPAARFGAYQVETSDPLRAIAIVKKHLGPTYRGAILARVK